MGNCKTEHENEEIMLNTPSPCFTAVYFTLFCFNAFWQFKQLLNLRSLISGLTPYGSLRSIMLNPYFWMKCHFWFKLFFFIYAQFFKSQLERKEKLRVLWITFREYQHRLNSRQIIVNTSRTNICADRVNQPLPGTVTEERNFRLMSHCTSPCLLQRNVCFMAE
jgi:hypothetical protein